MPDLPLLWSADQVAEQLSFTRQHVYRLAREGRIPCLKLGGALRFPAEEVKQWIDGHRGGDVKGAR